MPPTPSVSTKAKLLNERSTRTFSLHFGQAMRASGSASVVSMEVPHAGQVCKIAFSTAIRCDCNIDNRRSNETARFVKTLEETSTTLRLLVPKEAARLRLDRFLAKELPRFSRSRFQQLIRDGFVRLNGKAARPGDILRASDIVDVTEPPPEKIDNQPEAIPLHILFEDDDLIVIDKPAGLVVHPGAGHREHT